MMAINLGNEAVRLIRELQGNPDFGKLLEALVVVVNTRVYASLKAPVDLRVQQTAHADGMDELVESMRAAHQGVLPSQLAKTPAVKPAGKTREITDAA
jgi:hypothetical protein